MIEITGKKLLETISETVLAAAEEMEERHPGAREQFHIDSSFADAAMGLALKGGSIPKLEEGIFRLPWERIKRIVDDTRQSTCDLFETWLAECEARVGDPESEAVAEVRAKYELWDSIH